MLAPGVGNRALLPPLIVLALVGAVVAVGAVVLALDAVDGRRTQQRVDDLLADCSAERLGPCRDALPDVRYGSEDMCVLVEVLGRDEVYASLSTRDQVNWDLVRPGLCSQPVTTVG